MAGVVMLTKLVATVGPDSFTAEGDFSPESILPVLTLWFAALHPADQRAVDALTARLHHQTDQLQVSIDRANPGADTGG